VNDYAGLLRPAEREQLESRLAERERATGAQVVVAIFRSLEGESLEDYSIRLAERWRIGQKGLDNGVILLIFVEDRKVRMEVGYGLEPVIPDIVAGTLIRDTLAPRFREGRYADGIRAVTDAVYARIAGETSPTPATRPAGRKQQPLSPAAVLLLLLMFGIFGVAVVSAIRNASRRGITASRRGWTSSGPIIFPGGGWSRGGGGWSGGGGGGFSGGGGSFGGGGASGSW
jgi:uncharacterized protein